MNPTPRNNIPDAQIVHGRSNPTAVALVLLLAGGLYLLAIAIEAGWVM